MMLMTEYFKQWAKEMPKWLANYQTGDNVAFTQVGYDKVVEKTINAMIKGLHLLNLLEINPSFKIPIDIISHFHF